MTETQHAVTSVSEQVTRLREGIVQYIQVEGKIREGQTETGLVRDQVYEQLGKQMNMDVAVLREKLPQAAEQLKRRAHRQPVRASERCLRRQRLSGGGASGVTGCSPSQECDADQQCRRNSCAQARGVRRPEANQVCHGHGASSRGSRAD